LRVQRAPLLGVTKFTICRAWASTQFDIAVRQSWRSAAPQANYPVTSAG